MNDVYTFTKLENGTFLNEDSLRTEVHEVGDCLIWHVHQVDFMTILAIW